jgi:hypothetical protein
MTFLPSKLYSCTLLRSFMHAYSKLKRGLHAMTQAVDKKSDLSSLGFSVEEANLLNMSTKVGPALQVLFEHASNPVAFVMFVCLQKQAELRIDKHNGYYLRDKQSHALRLCLLLWYHSGCMC